MIKPIAVALILTLACTAITLMTIGEVPVSIFLLVSVPALTLAAIYFFIWRGRVKLFGVWVIAAYICLSSLINLHDAKLTSVIYSGIFLLTFLVLMNCRRYLPVETFSRTLRAVIILYFANVVISQVLVMTGAADDVLGNIFHRLYDERIGVVRYYGFSSEPSYAAFVVLVSFLGWYSLPGAASRRQLLLYSALVLYQVVAFSSIYGYLLAVAVAGVIAYRELPRRIFYLLPATLLLVAVMADFQTVVDSGSRVVRIAQALVSGQILSALDLNDIDSSLFLRIAPFTEYFNSLNPADYHCYLGHGAMASTSFMTDTFLSHVHPDGDTVRTGFIPAFLYDYGLIGASLVIVLLLRLISGRKFSLAVVIFLAMLFNANFNTQLFWYIVIVFALVGLYQPPPIEINTAHGRLQPEEAGA
ncbi:MAG: hypothetical protein ABII79_04675 [bacterium]